MNERHVDAFDPNLWRLRSIKYKDLEWVNARKPLEQVVELASLKGDEFVVDIGTGSQAILSAIREELTPEGTAVGFDISPEMLYSSLNGKDNLFIADAISIPIKDNRADIVTARMVFHHLQAPELGVSEASRLLCSDGKLIVSEFIALDETVQDFGRGFFEIKERGRHLWTDRQLAELIGRNGDFKKIEISRGKIGGYNMVELMRRSGLPLQIQQEGVEYIKSAPERIKQKLNIRLVSEDKVLMDLHNANVLAIKS